MSKKSSQSHSPSQSTVFVIVQSTSCPSKVVATLLEASMKFWKQHEKTCFTTITPLAHTHARNPALSE